MLHPRSLVLSFISIYTMLCLTSHLTAIIVVIGRSLLTLLVLGVWYNHLICVETWQNISSFITKKKVFLKFCYIYRNKFKKQRTHSAIWKSLIDLKKATDCTCDHKKQGSSDSCCFYAQWYIQAVWEHVDSTADGVHNNFNMTTSRRLCSALIRAWLGFFRETFWEGNCCSYCFY